MENLTISTGNVSFSPLKSVRHLASPVVRGEFTASMGRRKLFCSVNR